MDNTADKWRYERGEGRRKHLWNKDYAGFHPSGRGPVGKCPRHITEKIAQQILNKEAIPVYDGDGGQFPDRFYAVYKGVIWGVQKRGFKAIFFAQLLDLSRKNG